jgi:ATP-dependent Lon protease
MNGELIFEDSIISYIINKTDKEDGVRNLNRSLESIISNINVLKLTETNNSTSTETNSIPDNNKNESIETVVDIHKPQPLKVHTLNIIFTSPMTITEKIVDVLINKMDDSNDEPPQHMYM